MSDYSNLTGKTTIAPEVLHTIARLSALNVPGVSRMAAAQAVRVNRIFKRGPGEGVVIDIQDDTVFADLYLVLKNDVNIRDVCRSVQREVARAISEMVGMQVGRVNIHVEDIDYPTEAEA
ncbi:MAG: Asp23/Gls24 family envelope stress response protein [Omnitrophica WOR_2 bacterium]